MKSNLRSLTLPAVVASLLFVSSPARSDEVANLDKILSTFPLGKRVPPNQSMVVEVEPGKWLGGVGDLRIDVIAKEGPITATIIQLSDKDRGVFWLTTAARHCGPLKEQANFGEPPMTKVLFKHCMLFYGTSDGRSATSLVSSTQLSNLNN